MYVFFKRSFFSDSLFTLDSFASCADVPHVLCVHVNCLFVRLFVRSFVRSFVCVCVCVCVCVVNCLFVCL